MRILLVGAGGVGDAIVKIAASRDFYDIIVVSDYDFSKRSFHRRAGHQVR
jgi:saccharopine dehydrogenase-like NADP-dependent oxidoreductase